MLTSPKSLLEEWAKPTPGGVSPIRGMIIDVEPVGNETAEDRSAAGRTRDMAGSGAVRSSPAGTDTAGTWHHRHEATLVRFGGWIGTAFRAIVEITIIVGSALLLAGVAAYLSFILLLFMVEYWQR